MADLGGFVTQNTPSRRDFLKRSTALAAGAALAGGLSVARAAHAAGSDLIRIALIGCGGRGTGAAVNALSNKAYPNVKLVAMADAFQNRAGISLEADQPDAARTRSTCPRSGSSSAWTPTRRRSTAASTWCCSARRRASARCSSRPRSRPASTSSWRSRWPPTPPACRRILAANEEAKKKNLLVAVGHHLRHEVKHREVIQPHPRRRRSATIKFMRVYFNSSRRLDPPAQPDADGNAVPGPQLVLLHLAQRRPHRRAARPRPRRRATGS